MAEGAEEVECHKRKFTSKRQAKAALKAGRNYAIRKGFSIRLYWCRRCCGWHITNSDKRTAFLPKHSRSGYDFEGARYRRPSPGSEDLEDIIQALENPGQEEE